MAEIQAQIEEEKPKTVKKTTPTPKKSKINKDGIEGGKVLTEAEYWAIVNKKK